MAKTNNTKNSGFSLVELAVVITIMGIMVGGGLMVAIGKRELQRAKKTLQHMHHIMDVIDQFVDYYGYLPCPADGTQAFSSATFGIGTASGNQEGAAATTCTAANLLTSGTVKTGVVPVYTLGLPPEYVMDGWNNRITYAVDQDLTYYGTDGVGGFVDTTGLGAAGTIIVENQGGTETTDPADRPVVLIVSHGPNGFGAWGGRGGARISVGGGGADEDENDDGDLTFVQSILSSDFDDTVLYWVKWKLTGNE